jgi:hypothetical protein
MHACCRIVLPLHAATVAASLRSWRVTLRMVTNSSAAAAGQCGRERSQKGLKQGLLMAQLIGEPLARMQEGTAGAGSHTQPLPLLGRSRFPAGAAVSSRKDSTVLIRKAEF